VPSPVAHALAGLAVAWLARQRRLVLVCVLGLAAIAPDFDFVPGILIGRPGRYHHWASHSLTAAIAFAAAAWAIARWCGLERPGRLAWLMGLAYCTHLLLDMLSVDVRPPEGVPLLWPFDSRFVTLPFDLFLDIRRTPRVGFLRSVMLLHNAYAVAWELVVMGLAAAVIHAASVTIARRRAPEAASRTLSPGSNPVVDGRDRPADAVAEKEGVRRSDEGSEPGHPIARQVHAQE
jgi:membrane-bound metal-dependent hydrolase YbcI (DUF457 family)